MVIRRFFEVNLEGEIVPLMVGSNRPPTMCFLTGGIRTSQYRNDVR